MTIVNIGIYIPLGKLEGVMQIKPNKNPFFISSQKFFLKYGLQDNHWVMQSVMKPIDAQVFQKNNQVREGKY